MHPRGGAWAPIRTISYPNPFETHSGCGGDVPPPPVRPVITLSAPAQVLVTVQRRGRKAAVRAVTLAGRQGVNRVRLPRWAGRGALAPGAYVVRARANVDPGGAASTRLVVLPR